MKEYSNIISERSREYTEEEVKQGMLEWKLQKVHEFWTDGGYEKIDSGIDRDKRQVWWEYGKPLAK